MGRFSRGGGGGDRNARDRVLSSYNSNRRRLLGDRSEGRSFTVTRGSSSRGGGDRGGDRDRNRSRDSDRDRSRGGEGRTSRFRGDSERRTGGAGRGGARRIGGGRGGSDRQRSGRTGTVSRRNEHQQGKRERVNNKSRVGKRTGGGGDRDRSEGGARRVRKGAVKGGRRGRGGDASSSSSSKSRRNEGNSGPANASSMDNMLEAYQSGKNEQEIRAAGRVAQIQSRLDDALANYQNGPDSSSSNNSKGGNSNLDNSLEKYMSGK